MVGHLGCGLAKTCTAVAEVVANADAGADLATGHLEPTSDLCDLEVNA